MRIGMVKLTKVLLAAVVTAGALVTGCVKRSETISVAPDGSAKITVEFEAKADEFGNGAAMLDDPGPWKVSEKEQIGENEELEITRTGTLQVPAGGSFPTHYAGGDRGKAELDLHLMTEVWAEQREDGLYYHFRRTYQPRRWARIEYYRQTYLKDAFEKLEDTPSEELTNKDREDIAQALLTFEAVKLIKFAEAAAEAVDPPFSQDAFLGIHGRMASMFEEFEDGRVQKILLMADEEAEAAIADMVQEVNDRIYTIAREVLAKFDPSGLLAKDYLEQLERERQRYTITEDLQDETFEVIVELPGKIVGHNSIGNDPDGGEIRFEFQGDALNDREVVLMASSVVSEE